MAMYNPPHPGEFIKATYMGPFDLSCRYLAKQLNVATSTLNRVLKKQSGISPEMALRLSKAYWGEARRVGWLCRMLMIYGRIRELLN